MLLLEWEVKMTKKKEPTITVEGWFGKDKEVTRDEYVKLWADNATLYRLIDYSQLEYMEAWAKSIKDDIAELAVDELQEIIEITEKKAADIIMKARESWFN